MSALLCAHPANPQVPVHVTLDIDTGTLSPIIVGLCVLLLAIGRRVSVLGSTGRRAHHVVAGESRRYAAQDRGRVNRRAGSEVGSRQRAWKSRPRTIP